MFLSDRNRYAAILAVIAVLILTTGILLRPYFGSHHKNGEERTVTRAELEGLQQLVRRNSLRNLSNTFASVGEQASSRVALIQPWGVSGVIIPKLGLIVPKRLDALPREGAIGIGAAAPAFSPGSWIPGLPFFRSSANPGTDLVESRLATAPPQLATWVLVVAENSAQESIVSPGIYNGFGKGDCGPFIQNRMLTTIPLNNSHLGGALIDLEGDLHGVVVPCDDGPAVIPVSEIQRAISGGNSPTGTALSMYGVRFRSQSAGGSASPSVVVQETWDNWPAEDADLRPGDEILSVDNQQVSLPQEAAAILGRAAPSGHDLRIRRGQRRITIHLSPIHVGRVSSEGLIGVVPNDDAGVALKRVLRGSSADRADIRPSDRILEIDGMKASIASVERALGDFRVPEPSTVLVQRPGRRVLIWVTP
ncbi:MAG TPA: PDZ domain-containing protein [Terriglobales bacterium]|nr:PDZ domain-containing protein [Terriglobales bacterium]